MEPFTPLEIVIGVIVLMVVGCISGSMGPDNSTASKLDRLRKTVEEIRDEVKHV